MRKKFTILTAALALLAMLAVPTGGWGQTRATKTEGFENKDAGQNYQSTVTINENESDCGIGWEIFYGCVSSGTPISGSKSAQMRLYSNGTKGYLKSTTAIDGLSKVDFKAKVSDSNVKMDVHYSSDNQNWDVIATAVSVSTSVQNFSYDIPAGGKYIKISVSGSSTNPNSSNYQFRVDDVVFTYSAGPSCSVAPTSWAVGDVQAGSATQSQTFTVTASNLTSGLSFNLLDGTYYSITNGATGMSSSETSKDIVVQLNPTAVGAMDDYLIISGSDFGDDIEVELTANGLCNAPATALAFTSPVNLTLSGSSVGCALNPTANTGNGGTISYAITQGDVNNGILIGNEFEAEALGTWVVTATQVLNGTTCGGTADITINVYGPDQTITFNGGSGTPSSASITAAQGSTIQLPSALPSPACADAGWTFAGWTDEVVTETTSAPDVLLNAGEDYVVTITETLYAVYMQGGSSNCSVTFSDSGYENGEAVTSASIGNCATVTFDKGTNSNPPKYYNSGSAIRCYGGNKITIDAGNKTITDITLSLSSGNALSADVGNYNDNNGTWTGNANSVVFTVSGSSGNRPFAGISITCSGTTTYNSNPSCQEQVATPVITLAEGTYTEVKTTTITCETPDATIYYTTDGTDPTTSSNQYTTGTNITIGQSMTLKAIAVKENMENSNIASATYTINIQYTLTINNENGNIRDIHVFDDPTGIEPILYIDGYSGEELTEASIDAGTVIYVSVGGVVDCKVFDALTVTCGGSPVTPSYDDDMYSFTLNGNTNIAVSATDAEEYTLTVAGLEHVSFDLLVGSESDITSLDANHQATVCEDVLVEVIGLTVGNGFSLQSVTLAYGGETQTITPNEYGVYAFNMPSSNATLAFITGNASYFEAFTGELTEGDYLIVYNGKAMKNSVTSNRLDYIEVTATNDIICADNSIIWHIAPSGDYWTIYNAAVEKYAAGNGTKNQAALLDSGTDNGSLWTASGTSSYEFVNKKNAASNVNSNLRNNGTYGFACYASSTGGALSLYKKVTPETYTTMEIQPNQWYFIASPTGTSPTNVEALSDLYYYDEQDHHWRNQKVFANAGGFVNFDLGKGYLCANTGESAVTLTFTGVAITANSYSVDLEYHANTSEGVENTLAGWNLVGNPFTSEAYIVRDYYVIGNDATTGKSIIVASEGGAIAPYTGVMVQAEGEGESVTFTTNAPENPSNGNLQMTVAQQVVTRDGVSTGSSTIDNAIVSFNEGSRLGKFYFGENDANIYIPQNGKEYAIVSAEAQGELPLNFRANENGQYTLTVNPEGIEMNYLHLIDNMTGANIDLLSTPAYTFNATTKDYESRFRLVFSAGTVAEDEAGDTFAYFNGGEWVVSNTGQATLQVVDVMGRVVSNQTVNGTTELSLNQVPGVYVLRLVSGDNVRTQKVIVK